LSSIRILLFLMTGVGLHSQVQIGSLPLTWVGGSGNCVETPDWQVHEYNEDFFILRQSGCTHYEKPFLYLIFGKGKALLLDTGAGKPRTAAFVNELLAKRGRSDWDLIVPHSHGHGDHTAGDSGFAAMSKARVIAPKIEDLKVAFGIANWPAEVGSIDLGERIIDAIPIPGHDDVSVAYYDRKTGVLLTGDSVYPGRLYVSKWQEFSDSIQRLVEFTRTRPIAHVLGTHIEQTRTPFRDYPVGTTFQPGEHPLELSRGHLLELAAALSETKNTTTRIDLRDFSIVPRNAPRPSFVSRDFEVPRLHETAKFKFVPLGPALAQHDYDAYMSSIDHLQKTFSNGSWPNKKITMADALKDVEGEITRFHSRESFTYAVLTPDGAKELGCVYIRPSRKEGYDAQVVLWVTAEQFHAGFESELVLEVKKWLAAEWPFKKVAFPKRDILPRDWDALPNKAH
jgi:hydroxyacylglutathione hydrolase